MGAQSGKVSPIWVNLGELDDLRDASRKIPVKNLEDREFLLSLAHDTKQQHFSKQSQSQSQQSQGGPGGPNTFQQTNTNSITATAANNLKVLFNTKHRFSSLQSVRDQVLRYIRKTDTLRAHFQTKWWIHQSTSVFKPLVLEPNQSWMGGLLGQGGGNSNSNNKNTKQNFKQSQSDQLLTADHLSLPLATGFHAMLLGYLVYASEISLLTGHKATHCGLLPEMNVFFTESMKSLVRLSKVQEWIIENLCYQVYCESEDSEGVRRKNVNNDIGKVTVSKEVQEEGTKLASDSESDAESQSIKTESSPKKDLKTEPSPDSKGPDKVITDKVEPNTQKDTQEAKTKPEKQSVSPKKKVKAKRKTKPKPIDSESKKDNINDKDHQVVSPLSDVVIVQSGLPVSVLRRVSNQSGQSLSPQQLSIQGPGGPGPSNISSNISSNQSQVPTGSGLNSSQMSKIQSNISSHISSSDSQLDQKNVNQKQLNQNLQQPQIIQLSEIKSDSDPDQEEYDIDDDLSQDSDSEEQDLVKSQPDDKLKSVHDRQQFLPSSETKKSKTLIEKDIHPFPNRQSEMVNLRHVSEINQFKSGTSGSSSSGVYSAIRGEDVNEELEELRKRNLVLNRFEVQPGDELDADDLNLPNNNQNRFSKISNASSAAIPNKRMSLKNFQSQLGVGTISEFPSDDLQDLDQQQQQDSNENVNSQDQDPNYSRVSQTSNISRISKTSDGANLTQASAQVVRGLQGAELGFRRKKDQKRKKLQQVNRSDGNHNDQSQGSLSGPRGPNFQEFNEKNLQQLPKESPTLMMLRAKGKSNTTRHSAAQAEEVSNDESERYSESVDLDMNSDNVTESIIGQIDRNSVIQRAQNWNATVTQSSVIATDQTIIPPHRPQQAISIAPSQVSQFQRSDSPRSNNHNVFTTSNSKSPRNMNQDTENENSEVSNGNQIVVGVPVDQSVNDATENPDIDPDSNQNNNQFAHAKSGRVIKTAFKKQTLTTVQVNQVSKTNVSETEISSVSDQNHVAEGQHKMEVPVSQSESGSKSQSFMRECDSESNSNSDISESDSSLEPYRCKSDSDVDSSASNATQQSDSMTKQSESEQSDENLYLCSSGNDGSGEFSSLISESSDDKAEIQAQDHLQQLED